MSAQSVIRRLEEAIDFKDRLHKLRMRRTGGAPDPELDRVFAEVDRALRDGTPVHLPSADHDHSPRH